jgi:hypothetical protein
MKVVADISFAHDAFLLALLVRDLVIGTTFQRSYYGRYQRAYKWLRIQRSIDLKLLYVKMQSNI